MQKTRQQIIDVLNHLGKATVQEIVDELHHIRGDQITPVTVRHHLNLLQKENLICCPEHKHRSKPGRPQHIYKLTDKAHDHLPTNYQNLTENLLLELRKRLPPAEVNVIIEGVADDMAAVADINTTSAEERMDMVVEYLDQQGYDASWETTDNAFVLHTSNCPYHEVAQHDDALCKMDMRLITRLVGVVPRRTALVAEGCATCSYEFPKTAFMVS
ncbi:MAG: hypothetical protein AAF125_09705 [Chloroflexota bacterium]